MPLYGHVLNRLTLINLRNDAAICAELVTLLEKMRGGWATVASGAAAPTMPIIPAEARLGPVRLTGGRQIAFLDDVRSVSFYQLKVDRMLSMRQAEIGLVALIALLGCAPPAAPPVASIAPEPLAPTTPTVRAMAPPWPAVTGCRALAEAVLARPEAVRARLDAAASPLALEVSDASGGVMGDGVVRDLPLPPDGARRCLLVVEVGPSARAAARRTLGTSVSSPLTAPAARAGPIRTIAAFRPNCAPSSARMPQPSCRPVTPASTSSV